MGHSSCSALGRFTQPDSLVPNPVNPQDWDRYAYVRNNPVKYNDPSGNKACNGFDEYGDCDPDNDWIPASWEPNTYESTNLPIEKLPDIDDIPLQERRSLIDNNELSIGSSCTITTPCLDVWEQPSWWDTDPTHQDYMSYSVSYGEIAGATVILVIDRYGQVFVSFGINVGKSLTPLSGSAMRGWVGDPFDDDIPSPMALEEFQKGLGVNANIGALGGGGVSWKPINGYYSNHFGYEEGAILIAQMGVSIGYSIMIPYNIK